MLEEIEIESTQTEQLIDITAQVEKALKDLKCKDGICLVYTPHTTAAITINENADPDVARDILSGLKRIVPESGFRHAEGNSPAHIKSSLVGCPFALAVQNFFHKF